MIGWRGRRPRLLLLLAAGGAVVVLGVLVSRQDGLGEADKIASVIAALVGIVGLALELRGRVADRAVQAAPLQDTLADRTLQPTYDAEWQRRRLHDPAPLPVTWVNADELADHWQNIHDAQSACPSLPLHGRFGELGDTFDAVPSRRLVIVGPGGLGKTVLLLHLARQLLDRRAPGGPVPIVLSLATWNPHKTSLRDWLAERLPIDVAPALGAAGTDRRTGAQQLVEDGLVVPLLDGLDELPTHMHARAIQRINDGGRAPLVLTCREEQYAAAIETAHDVVTAAAAIRLVPLDLSDVFGWLGRTTRGSAAARGKWQPLEEAAGAGAQGLGTVLSSPLMVSMARAVYSETAAQPRELLDRGDRTAEIEDHLLGQLVPTAFRDLPRSDEPGARRGTWTLDRVEGFLKGLSRHLTRRGSERIEWWRVHGMVPRWRCRLLKGLLVGLVAVATGSVLSLAVPFDMAMVAFVQAPMLALVAVIAERDFAGQPPVALRFSVRPNLRGIMSLLHGSVVRGAVAGLLIGVPVLGGVVLSQGVWSFDGWGGVGALAALLLAILVLSVVMGAGFGLAFGLPLAIADCFTAPIELDRVIGPAALARADRSRAVVRALIFGAALGILLVPSTVLVLFGVLHLVSGTGTLFGGPHTPIAPLYLAWVELPNVVALAVPGAVAFLLTSTAWGQFAFAQVYLGLIGRAPWRLLALLDTARDRGVLRQNGPAYLFRHERLQAYLGGCGVPDPMETEDSGPLSRWRLLRWRRTRAAAAG